MVDYCGSGDEGSGMNRCRFLDTFAAVVLRAFGTAEDRGDRNFTLSVDVLCINVMKWAGQETPLLHLGRVQSQQRLLRQSLCLTVTAASIVHMQASIVTLEGSIGSIGSIRR